MISSGIQVLCGKTMGRGDREATNACYTVSVFLSAVISAVGLILVFGFMGPLTTLLGAGTPGPDNPVYDLTKDYITGFIPAAPAFLLAQIMIPYMQLSGCRTRLIVAVAAMTVADVVFDLLNVFVFHGGTLGMGLASTLSYYIAFGVGLGFFLRKDCVFRFRRRLIKASIAKEMIVYGIPTMLNQVSIVFLVFVLNRLLLEVEGTVAVAAYSVISTVGNICYCLGAGVGAVAMMLGAIFYADRDRTSICELVRVMTRDAVILDLVLTVAGLIASNVLVALFLGADVAAQPIAAGGLRLFILSITPASVNTSFRNYYQGVGRLWLSELVSVLQNFFLPVMFAFILSRFLGADGVWLGFPCGELAALIVFSVIVWRHHGGFSLSAEAYSMLDRDFGTDPENCLERSIASVQEAADVSQQICEFCRERGVDKRTSMLIGLCTEEMTVNIIEHGFTKDKLTHHVDVRLVLEDGSRIIRIRDNCIHFDPTKYLELHQTNDPAAHIGLRMVMGMVKEAGYVNSLGLNNLTLTL